MLAQTTPNTDTESPQLNTISTTQSIAPQGTGSQDTSPGDVENQSASEPFRLPVEQHFWARFQPGAWRELRTVTETFDGTEIVSRNTTTQREVLQAVVDGTYVLQVQATVELPGKCFVGEWNQRVLHLAIDSAGPIINSRRLEDETLALAGATVLCQVWELRYRDEARNLVELIHYDPQTFPYVLQRETFTDTGSENGTAIGEQQMQAMARDVPYRLGEQLVKCACLRTSRHRAKGDTLTLTFASPTVPGGEMAAWTTDFDSQGQRIRWSVTSLLGSGESPPSDYPMPSSR